MAPILYIINESPPCRIVLFVAKQLDIQLDVVVIDMKYKQEHLKPEFLKLNPSHTVPTLDDNGVGVWESRAIVQYLCNKYCPDSQLYPKPPDRRARVDTALYWCLGTWHPVLRNTLFDKMLNDIEPTKDQIKTLNNALQVLDALIGANGGYVAANHLTIADMSLLAKSEPLLYLDYDLTAHPNVKQWFKQLSAELKYFNQFKTEMFEVIQNKLMPTDPKTGY